MRSETATLNPAVASFVDAIALVRGGDVDKARQEVCDMADLFGPPMLAITKDGQTVIAFCDPPENVVGYPCDHVAETSELWEGHTDWCLSPIDNA